MFELGKKPKFPNFAALIERLAPRSPLPWHRTLRLLPYSAFLPGAILGLVSGLAVHWAIGLLVFLVTTPALFLLMQRFAQSRIRADDPEMQLRLEGFAALERFQSIHQRRKLHREVDGVALQLLEAISYWYLRALDILNSGVWVSPDLGGQWKGVRAQALGALDAALFEALVLCQQCIGQPPKKKNLSDFIEDILDLDILDALEGLKVGSGRRFRGYESPHIRVVFEPVRDLAERIKSLAEEVETLSKDLLSSQRSVLGARLGGDASIELVLREIKELRKAESELDEAHRHERS